MNSIIIKLAIGITVLILLTSKTGTGQSDPNHLQRLTSWMTGSFSSKEQALADSNFFDICLEMVRIWKNRNDGSWLYVEQAAASSLQKPYRQRVYHLQKRDNGLLESATYIIKDPLRFAGDWRNEQPLKSLRPDSLMIRQGCTIVLQWQDSVFVGGTQDKQCISHLRGAAYATSEVRIENDRFISWDRGFDENDKQVWGAEAGPYIFRKIKDY
ncbi:MAG: hypothetical protein GF313_11280 [Caldithrix sp.]|nr:hypothetical protein [Caldithrix sp.]